MMDPMVASPTGSLLRWTSRIAVVLLCALGVYFLVAAYLVNQKNEVEQQSPQGISQNH